MMRILTSLDELARMERICPELAKESALPLERAGLLDLAANIGPLPGRYLGRISR